MSLMHNTKMKEKTRCYLLFFYFIFIGSTCFGHHSSLPAPNFQPTATQVMYNFRFTTLINTNNTSNYQSTNETHYTQQNTNITTHKGSQLLILTETCYQLQPSDKELHTEHTPLRTIILHQCYCLHLYRTKLPMW